MYIYSYDAHNTNTSIIFIGIVYFEVCTLAACKERPNNTNRTYEHQMPIYGQQSLTIKHKVAAETQPVSLYL